MGVDHYRSSVGCDDYVADMRELQALAVKTRRPSNERHRRSHALALPEDVNPRRIGDREGAYSGSAAVTLLTSSKADP